MSAGTKPFSRPGASGMSNGWQWLGRSALTLFLLPLGYALVQLSNQLLALSGAEIQQFWQQSGLWPSLWHTLWVGLLPTALALYTSLLLVLRQAQPPTWVAGLLAMPHVAFAVGLAFLLTPAGWLERLLPALSMPVPEKSMALLVVTLWLKELPFVLLMTAVAMQQLPLAQWRLVSTSLGHAGRDQFSLLAWPALLQALRLPLIVVVVYGISVVDVPLVSGPNVHAPLAVKVMEWQQQFTPRSQAFAVQGQWLLLGLALLAVALVWLHEQLVCGLARWRLSRGPRVAQASRPGRRVSGWSPVLAGATWLGRSVLWLTTGLTLLALVLLVVWSLADHWPGSQWRPLAWTLAHWQWEWSPWLHAVGQSAWLAVASASLALLLNLILLEWQSRGRWLPQWWLLLPVCIPQLPLVAGWQLGLSPLGADFGAWWVLFAHTLFATAYGYLLLSRHYRQFEPQWLRLAQTLGYSENQAWWRVKLRMLAAPMLMAWAVAFSVSILQYVPTILLGGGRLVTITTEATAYGSGFDRSLAAVYALGQVVLPLAVFLLAVWLNRRVKVARPMC